MNQANNLAQVDPLGWLASQVESHRALSMSDAYYAQELPRVEAVYSAVAELAAAARLIANGAMPATASGATCFVPRYEVVNLRKALRPFTGERA